MIPAQFEQADRFSEGLAVVVRQHKVGSIDVKNRFGYINETGKLVIPAKFDAADNIFRRTGRRLRSWTLGLYQRLSAVAIVRK